MTAKRIAILGSTGSIGQQTLDVLRTHPAKFDVVGLAAHRNHRALLAQAQEFGAPFCCLSGPPEELDEGGRNLPGHWPGNLFVGPDALVEWLEKTKCDLLVSAISGGAGLAVNLRALELGIDLAVANKESLVMAGNLIMATAKESGSRVIPIDSEHSAILQCLRSGTHGEMRRIILTASGGPFRGMTRDQLRAVTRTQALEHPTWKMGPKITVDSATLMNKALEIIEAHVLFEASAAQIDVVVHPQSIVHSLVEFHDGSLVAHLGPADMRIPIQYALSEPDRWERPTTEFSITDVARLDFEAPDHDTFPSLRMAWEACRLGQSLPVVLNAANERAVELFLQERIAFHSIFELVQRALEEHNRAPVPTLRAILEVDRHTRENIDRWI